MNNEEKNYDNNREVHSTVVRAGKRTYFFDIKSTRNEDLYLTITESKKNVQNGKVSYQKHKVFLYKEDFDKFTEALTESLEKIDSLKADGKYLDDNFDSRSDDENDDNDDLSNYTSLEYEDL